MRRGETALILHDGSEIEQPESVRVEGLCPVRSAKGRRLSRPRPKVHCVSPTAGAPILVLVASAATAGISGSKSFHWASVKSEG